MSTLFDFLTLGISPSFLWGLLYIYKANIIYSAFGCFGKRDFQKILSTLLLEAWPLLKKTKQKQKHQNSQNPKGRVNLRYVGGYGPSQVPEYGIKSEKRVRVVEIDDSFCSKLGKALSLSRENGKAYFILVYFFGLATQLAGSQFLDQGLNPGHGSESLVLLTTGPPENSHTISSFNCLCMSKSFLSFKIRLR